MDKTMKRVWSCKTITSLSHAEGKNSPKPNSLFADTAPILIRSHVLCLTISKPEHK